MTTARSNAGTVNPARGRGLDALFEGTTVPAAPVRNVDADLAALLDDEVLAAETGGQTAAAPRTRGVDAGGMGAEAIDVPPVTPVVEPTVSEPVRPRPVATQPETERRLPTTKRFGAIIMDAETLPAQGDETQPALPMVPETSGATPPGPGTDLEEPLPLPAKIERTEDQKSIVISRLDKVLDKGWQKALHQQIDELYKQVATEFSSPPVKAERALTMLREARQLLIDSPEEYVTAEYRTMQVRAMLDRVQESRKQSGHFGPRVLAYQAGWLLVLLLGLVFAAPLTQWITSIGRVTGPALLNLYPIFNTMLWGGIGGVVGALYTLWWHISREQDFDRNYMMWYLVQPMLGLVLGGIIFLVLAGGFLILQVSLTDEKASEGARLLPYLTAVLAGFRQNFVYDQLDRLISLFTPATRKENNGEGPSA